MCQLESAVPSREGRGGIPSTPTPHQQTCPLSGAPWADVGGYRLWGRVGVRGGGAPSSGAGVDSVLLRIKGSGLKLSTFFDGLTEGGIATRVRGRARKVALANVAFPCCCWLTEGRTGELFLPSSHDPPDFSLSVWGHETAKLGK